jgi:hypothetical protein
MRFRSGVGLVVVTAAPACVLVLGDFEKGSPATATGAGGRVASTGGAGGMATGGGSGGSSSSLSGGVACQPGTTEACYSGPSGTLGQGSCKGGTASCAANGILGTCAGEVTPEPNNCASGLNLFCAATTPTCTGSVVAGGRAWGEANYDQGDGIAVDSLGNAVVTGLFSGPLDFGNGHPLTPAGESDAFVAQYSPTGALNWVVQFLDTSGAEGTAVTVDANDNVFVVGTFGSQVEFQTTPQPKTVKGGPGIFVAKLDKNGNAQWGNGYLGNVDGVCTANSVAVSPDGTTVAVAGYATGQLTLGATSIQTGTSGTYEGVVFTLDSSSGAIGWVQQLSGSSADGAYLYGVAIDTDDSVVVAGGGTGDVDFGGASVTAPGTGDNLIVARYSAEGGNVWEKLFGDGTSSDQFAYAVALGSGGDVFLTGTFQKQITFGAVSVDAAASAPADTSEVFVARLDENGTAIWGQAFTPSAGGSAMGFGVAADEYGVVAGGAYSGSLSAGSTTLACVGGLDAFVLKLEVTDGSVLWAKSFGEVTTAGEDATVTHVALDPRNVNPLGASAVVGYFREQVNVGMGPVDTMGDADIFFARLAP